MAEACKQPCPGDIYWHKALMALCFNGIEEKRQVCAGGWECEQSSHFRSVMCLLAWLQEDHEVVSKSNICIHFIRLF